MFCVALVIASTILRPNVNHHHIHLSPCIKQKTLKCEDSNNKDGNRLPEKPTSHQAGRKKQTRKKHDRSRKTRNASLQKEPQPSEKSSVVPAILGTLWVNK